MSDAFLPFEYGISLGAFSIDKYHNTALPTQHVSKYIFEVGFAFVLVEQISDFFFEQFSLKHVFDDYFFGGFYLTDDLLQPLGLDYYVGVDDCDGVGKVDLLGIEEGLFHFEVILFKIANVE